MANNAISVLAADAVAVMTHNQTATPQQERERILGAYHERRSLRGLSRTFGVSRQTVTAWLKKRDDSA
jgi:hypothetical protein